MNEKLGQPFTEDEISPALAQMCPIKVPGPNGLPTIFFQKHWMLFSKGILSICLYVLNQKVTLASLSHTYIALISKVKKPMKVSDFRLISLWQKPLANLFTRNVVKDKGL